MFFWRCVCMRMLGLVGQVQRRDQPQSVHSQSSSPEVRSHPVIVLPAVGPNSSASDRSVALHVRSIDNMQPLHSPSAHQPQAPALAVFLSSAQSEAAAQPAHLQMIISNCDPVCPLSQEETPHQISTSPCAGTYQEESTDQEGDATQARVPVPASAVGTCGMCHRRYQIPNQDQVITPVVVENAHPSPAGRADSCGAVE